MRHVTDGELHAYLDSALDALSAERADEVRAHLGSCSVCQERLQDEERVRSSAQELLGITAPASAAPPPFEELRELVQATADGEERTDSPDILSRRRWKPMRGLPLAWAATIVLALGVGWMGGQVWRSLPQEGVLPSATSPVSGEDLGGQAAPAETSESEEANAVQESVRPSDIPLGELSDKDRLEESQPVPSFQLDAVVTGIAPPVRDEVREEGAPGVVLADSVESRISQFGVVSDSAELLARMRREVRGVDTATARLDEEPSAPERAQVTPVSAFEALDVVPSDTVAAEAKATPSDDLESTLAVPGLPVLSMEWEEWIPGEKGLNIRQLLPSGDTLELRYLGMLVGKEADPRQKEARRAEEEAVERPPTLKGLEASLRPGWNQVVMRWGRGWLVARAPLPQESIRTLLRSLFRGPPGPLF